MGRKRFKTKADLEIAWEAYKEACDNHTVLTHDFSSRNSEFVSAELRRSITYTIIGFCVFVGISRQALYADYLNKKPYLDIATRMREECEFDARRKFETGVIPPQLAALWMSKHGYSTKTETAGPADDREDDNLYNAIGEAVKKATQSKDGAAK